MDAEPLEIDADPTGTTDYLHQAALSSFAPMATAVNLIATTGSRLFFFFFYKETASVFDK